MGNSYDELMRVMHYAPEANAALLALQREDGYPRELVASVGRRFCRILGGTRDSIGLRSLGLKSRSS